MPQQQVLDYEPVARAYRGEQDCEQEAEAFEHALSIADLRPREVLPSHTAATANCRTKSMVTCSPDFSISGRSS